MSSFCGNCGTQVDQKVAFCPSCGAEIAPGLASAYQGVKETPVYSQAGAGHGLAGALKRFFKEPKQLIMVVILVLFWLVLSLLAAWGINPWPVRFLSFLTFAQGGMYGGLWGALGGIIGKAVFAYFFSALLLPLFTGKNPFKAPGAEFKGFASLLALQGLNAAAQFVAGLGFALILFNFFTGNASLVNSMAGLVGGLLALKALLGPGDLLRNFVLLAASKLSGGKTPSAVAVNRVIAGYGAGSLLGVALSAVPLPYLAYTIGALLFVLGVILNMATKPRKAVPAS